MALTAEQQAEIQLEIDKQVFRLNAEADAGVYVKEQARETSRRAHEVEMEQRRARLEMIRLAKETLLENDRNKPTGERGITASDITNFADTLIDYVNN
jgi:aminoglycoside phosphotransferase